MDRVSMIFGSKVFNDKIMKERLSSDVYDKLKTTREEGKSLDPNIAEEVASAMKDWALENGVTHYTHWFQPLTGFTAEKHESFINSVSDDSIIMSFSGKALVKGEGDASSFPNGGLRATFEARGYTVWDPTSFAFIKDGTLYIPTAFCSYSGHSLDKKTPILRSMQALNKSAKRILKAFGKEVKRIKANVGSEQEYFLIDKYLFDKRPDLIFTGRTLFGSKPPKGQELEDHYYGAIKTRVIKFMTELDEELWKYGIFAKIKHNEAAPSQHEIVPIFTDVNIAADHNQLTMEIMKNLAHKHNLACLLHEKPFDGIAGSGKHNNWSLATDDGVNLLEPGETPHDNKQFLLFLASIVKAIDIHQGLLRASIATAGNDLRLGEKEAPPAVMSIYLGEELHEVIESIIENSSYLKKAKGEMVYGAKVLPKFFKDSTDRNRTSPIAFTGNKIEIRPVGAPASLSSVNVVLNTIVADVLREFADVIESSNDFEGTVINLIKNTFKEHRRIIFNGNNYTDAWLQESKKLGLRNLKDTVESLPYYVKEESYSLFERTKIFSREELFARYEILMENYAKTIQIEGRTLLMMTKRSILPAVSNYLNHLYQVKNNLNGNYERDQFEMISELKEKLFVHERKLQEGLSLVKAEEDFEKKAVLSRDLICTTTKKIRDIIDVIEKNFPEELWPYPSYKDLLFSV